MRMTVRLGFVAALGLALAMGAVAQTHKVAQPEMVVRAVGVYEWTGDLAKPAATRLIPVTLFIDGKLEDAGVYQARPVPFALLSGNYYELQQSGVAKGGLELSFARHLQAVDAVTGESAFDDGWFGYGSFHAPEAEKKATTLRTSSTLSEVTGSKDGSRPYFGNKSANAADKSAASNSGPDKDGTDEGGSTDAERPTMRRRGAGSPDAGSPGSGSSTAKDSSDAAKAGADAGTPGEDPDRPHLSKKSTPDTPGAGPDAGANSAGTVGSGSGAGAEGSGSAKSTSESAQGGSANDPDRPTLKRRSAEEIRRDRTREDKASVTAVGSLNDDPNRPNLHRGKPASAITDDDLPKLRGLPADLKQMVAVSDAANRTPHDFSRPWEDDKERSAILAKMQALARAKVAAYGKPQEAAAIAPKAPARRAIASTRVKKAAPLGSGIMLLEEDLKGYLLSYGGAATYVYSAHTAGDGASLDYVTVVAQADAMGALKPVIENVTDAGHLDRTPRMRLVDAVDAEAGNRASLLFEVRGQRSRQFALYRVIGAQAEEIFASGSTQ